MNGKQKRYLRSMGHTIRPSFQIGKEGLTDTIVSELLNYLEKNEIGKIHILKNCTMSKEAITEILEDYKIEVVQVIGNIVIIYKESKENKTIVLPK